MKRTGVILFMILLLLTSAFSFAEPENPDNLKPTWRSVEKFRVAYAESSPYISYAAHFYGLLIGLQELGWIDSLEGLPYKSGQEDTQVMWQWLVRNQPSRYLEFVSDGYYSFSGNDVRVSVAKNRVHSSEPDVDLMLVMGTSAGRSLTDTSPSIPVLIFSTSNAIASKIIDNETDSGKDNVWAHVDLARYKKQVQVFYDLFQFKKLGIVYEDSLEGRSFADLENVQATCNKLGVQLIKRNVKENKSEEEYSRYYEDTQKAYEELANEVDGFYITAGNLKAKDLTELFNPFYAKKIPVFSQIGGEEVKYGALISTAANYIDIGRYGAQVISRSLHGENPRKIPAVYEDTPNIVLNLDVARKIEYTPDFEILLIADHLYLDDGLMQEGANEIQ